MGEVVAVPYPSQGHINPMIQFCKRLTSYDASIKSTMAITRYIARTYGKAASVELVEISDGFDEEGFAGASSVAEYLERVTSEGSRSLEELLRSRKVKCVVYDAFLPWALEVAKKLGIPAAAFYTQSCTVNYVYYLIHHGRLSLPVTRFPLPFNGLHSLSGPPDMPSFVGLPGSHPAYFQMVLSQFSNAHRADFVLVNSVYELEPHAVDAMSEDCPLLTIGPTIPSKYLGQDHHHDTEYGLNLFEASTSVSDWLDAKPARSVVYVSFGSMANLSSDQMEELAWGLEATELPYLWVVRSEEERRKIPPGTKGMVVWSEEEHPNIPPGCKGLVVPWCTQLEVLSHPSLGCFFTHCGWNSTIEALTLGVPMLAMPQWTDQPTDAALVHRLWRVGTRLDPSALVSRHQIASCIRRVVASDVFRTNALTWSRKAINAAAPGGSSDNNFRRFVSRLLTK